MAQANQDNPLRQDGGLPPLFLAEIDPRLDWEGKSVERISDPVARLVVLWTIIGQYDNVARMNGGGPDGEPTVADAQRYQLMSTWAHESRRVMPCQRLEPTERSAQQRVLDKLGETPLGAYVEVVEIRDWMPEMMHPDVRFDLLYRIWANSTDLNETDSFRDIIARDMISETLPGGEGYCDNPERLRRYNVLSRVDPKFQQVVDGYLASCMASGDLEQHGYYDDKPMSITEVCRIAVERRYTELAQYMLDAGVLELDDEHVLLTLLAD